jgi:cytochrome c oxidase assembly protein subunit 11
MVDDHVADQLETITLSYTFYESSKYNGPKTQAALGAANSATGG